MARADYEIIGTSHDIIYIIDLDIGGVSVTNDAEAVVSEISAEYPGRRIVYRDTIGRWDELSHLDGRFQSYRPWAGFVPETDFSHSKMEPTNNEYQT